MAWELLGGALAAPDVRRSTDPGHERDLDARQCRVELEGRARRAVGASGDFQGARHFFLFRVDGVGAGATMRLVRIYFWYASTASGLVLYAVSAAFKAGGVAAQRCFPQRFGGLSGR